MIIKTRQTPDHLLQIKHLKARSTLDLSDYDSELKGLYGEQLLDKKMKTLDLGHAIVIQDLRLLDGKIERQFDTIVIVNRCVYILDAKYYTCDTRLSGNKFYYGSKQIEHPDLQMSRSETFLANYIWKYCRVDMTVRSHFVLVNDAVAFSNVDRHERVFAVKDLAYKLRELKDYPVMEEDYDVAEILVSHHRKKSIHWNDDLDLTDVSYLPGLKCPKCGCIRDVPLAALVLMPCCGVIHRFEDLMYAALVEFCVIHQKNLVKTRDFTKFITGSDKRNHVIERFMRANMKSAGKRGHYKF